MKAVAASVWYGKQTPGFVYKPSHTQTKPRPSQMTYYPLTKPEGGGPGLKAIKQDQNVAPGYYKVKRNLVERSTH